MERLRTISALSGASASPSGTDSERSRTKALPPMLSSQSSRINARNKNPANSSMTSSHRSRKKKREDFARILDDRGCDVTPLPLTNTITAQIAAISIGQQSLVDTHTHTGTGVGTTGLSDVSMTFAGDDEDRMLGANTNASANTDTSTSVNTHNNNGSDSDKPVVRIETPYDSFALSNPNRPTIVISETDTIMMFALPSLRVNENDSASYTAIKNENHNYNLLKDRKKEKDKFSVGFAQTINSGERDKAIQCSPSLSLDSAIQTSTWMIYDEIVKNDALTHACTDSGSGVGSKATVEAATQSDEKEDVELFATDDGQARGAPQAVPDSVTVRGVGDSAASYDSSSMSYSGGGNLSETQSTSELNLHSFTQTNNGSSNGAGPSLPINALQTLIQSQRNPLLTKLYGQSSFQSTLRIVEQAVLQNVYHKEQFLYRDLPLDTHSHAGGEIDTSAMLDHAAFISSNDKPRLILLFTFTHTNNGSGIGSQPLPVTCLSFNHSNPDLLAAGYGSHTFGSSTGGRVALWSVKNVSHPIKLFDTHSSVLACDFSKENPHLLAIGMANGVVAIYDVRSMSGSALMEASHSSGKHRSCVWQVKWIHRETSNTTRSEMLVSVSEDGTVRQWQMKKGLVPKELMILKRNQNPVHTITGNTSKQPTTNAHTTNGNGNSSAKSKREDSAAAQQTGPQSVSLDGLSSDACGLCFDFAPWDSSQYFAGTEDGWIHHCSVSYNEQTLDTFAAHTGAIYSIKCSPFVSDLFLSCSADWTCALWSVGRSGGNASSHTHTNNGSSNGSASVGVATPIIRFQCGFDDIVDCQWHPHHPTVFASVSRDGRVDVWDLEQSTLDPVCVHETARSGQSLAFSPNGSCVIVGNSECSIAVLRIEGIICAQRTQAGYSTEQQQARIEEIVYQNPSQKS